MFTVPLVPLLSGQPLLSGHFSKSRGRTVFVTSLSEIGDLSGPYLVF